MSNLNLIISDSIYGQSINNPVLIKAAPYVEVRINCLCGATYRVFVNGAVPIPIIPVDVICPGCGSSGDSGAWMISGHSGGYFNASAIKHRYGS